MNLQPLTKHESDSSCFDIGEMFTLLKLRFCTLLLQLTALLVIGEAYLLAGLSNCVDFQRVFNNIMIMMDFRLMHTARLLYL